MSFLYENGEPFACSPDEINRILASVERIDHHFEIVEYVFVYIDGTDETVKAQDLTREQRFLIAAFKHKFDSFVPKPVYAKKAVDVKKNSRVKCEYCGCVANKDYGTCDHCGAPLPMEEINA